MNSSMYSLISTMLLSSTVFFACDQPSSDNNRLTLSSEGSEWSVFEGEAHGDTSEKLGSLSIMERDLSLVQYYYVDSDKLVGERLANMLEMALENVEVQVDEVQFVLRNDEVIANVGTRNRTFPASELDDLSDLLRILQPIALFLDDALSENVDRAEVEYMLLNGTLSALDPHSILLPPVEAAEMEVDNQGEFGGLGIEISIQDGQLTVKQPIEDTPAWDAGLKSEDKIVRIENTSTINMDLDEAVSLMRGKVGDPVTIYVERSGWSAPKAFTIVRGRIKVDPVKGELLNDGVGYLKIQSFHQNVADDMNALLEDFQQQTNNNLRGLVLDLRNNPGGYLNQAIKVSDRFIRSGVLVATVEGAERTREENHAKSRNTLTTIPIVVLVNGNSASASEIVAGALRNQSRAIIVGERSFGKGSVQHLYGNPDDSRLKLTVAQYLTPGDQSIQSVGIPPDILLQPSIIRPATKTDEAQTEEMVSLYWRDWITREGDLERHLSNDSTLQGQTKYALRYLLEEKEGKDRTDPKKDWEVEFSRKLLLKTDGNDRASVMLAAAGLVEQTALEEQRIIQQQFNRVGVDWRAGTNHYPKAKEDLKITVDILGDGVLNAGEEETLRVKVHNASERPYHQLSILLKSDHPSVDHREFYIGYVDANQTVETESTITVPHGYGTETTEVLVETRDPTKILFDQTKTVQTKGKDMPKFAWTVNLYDGLSGKGKGNGNQIPEVGETIVLEVALSNKAPTNDAETTNDDSEAGANASAIDPYIRLKNRSRQHLDLLEGTLEVGKNSADCEEDCDRILSQGDTETGTFSFKLKSLPTSGHWDLEMLVGSNRTYDYNTTVQGGFSEYFQLKTTVNLSPKVKFVEQKYDQPQITLEQQTVQGDFFELSGFAEDESGITDILVFHGKEKREDKIYYKGETGLSGRVPFGLDVQLEKGSNPFYILVKDNQGLHTSQYVQVWKD